MQSTRTRPLPGLRKQPGPARGGGARAGNSAGAASGGRGAGARCLPRSARSQPCPSPAPARSPVGSREGRPGEFRRLLSIAARRNKKRNSKHLLRAWLRIGAHRVRLCSCSILHLHKPELLVASTARPLDPGCHKPCTTPDLNLPPCATILPWGPLEPQSSANCWVLSLFSARLHPPAPKPAHPTQDPSILTVPSREAVTFPTHACRSGRRE